MLRRYETELLDYVKSSHKALVDDLRKKQKLDEDTEPRLKAALKGFGEVFSVEKK